MSEKRNWKIIYSDYSGMEKKAIELVSKEMGALILRDKGVYTIHVLACEQEKNAVIEFSKPFYNTKDGYRWEFAKTQLCKNARIKLIRILRKRDKEFG